MVSTAEKAGYDVTAIVRNPRLRNVPRVVQHDLRFPLEDMPPADWIFHLAGGYAGADQQKLFRADSRTRALVLLGTAEADLGCRNR